MRSGVECQTAFLSDSVSNNQWESHQLKLTMATHSKAIDDWELVSVEKPAGESRTSFLNTGRSQATVTTIHADLIIPGQGKPLLDQVVVVENGKIAHVGPSDSIPTKYLAEFRQHVPVLLPGMWECHSHFMGASPLKPINSENLAMTSPAEAGARNARALKDTLYAGFTSCVDLGGYAPELSRVIDEQLILGPNLYGAGGAISMTAGHGDVFEIPYGSAYQKLSVNAPGTDVGSNVMLLADGPEECRKAVRINLRRGARVIKVMTSGGVTSRDDNPMYQQFSDDELHVIVGEARRMGMVCAAHAVGKYMP